MGASPAAIGIVSASGHFTLQGSRIWGNSTLFDGARVETGDASSQLALSNGVRVQLSANSTARIWQDHLILDRGAGQITATGKAAFDVRAAGMKVAGERFRVNLGERIEIAALTGDARLMNPSGAVLATVPRGRSMAFAMYQGVTLVGCLLYKDGGFILPVDDSQEVNQLRGPDLAANVGNRVEATGTVATVPASIAPATRVVDVTSIAPQSPGGCLTAAAAMNAQASMPANAPANAPTNAGGQAPAQPAGVSSGGVRADTGMSTGAKVAIAAVVIGGGAGAAVAVLGKKDSTSQ